MANLKVLNVQRALKLLKEFQNAVQVDDSNEELKELKERAEFALDYLFKLFAGKPGEVEVGSVPCTRRARSC